MLLRIILQAHQASVRYTLDTRDELYVAQHVYYDEVADVAKQ